MAQIPKPTDEECSAAKVPHDVFLSNLIANHILLFTGIATFGSSYIQFIVLVPILSFCAISYTFFKAQKVKREDSEFIWVHWQIAKRWSQLFTYVLLLLVAVSTLGWLGYTYLGMMKEAVFGLIGGLGLLPTLVSVLILVVIESDSLHHARLGTLPKWALKRFLGIEVEPESQES